ncbi:hypothetical protein FRC02_010668 [Tulasnella sp. 418]|nr:hypothetical protein FRC02_010668 [Tulasnella sp. 418]
MFKKSITSKTSAPLRSSDRRKLRNQIVKDFDVSPPEDGDLLVPEGIQSAKFTTHSGEEQGVVYIDSLTNDPLWFTIGKATTVYIPTVYTLWKRPLLFQISTPAPALQKVMGGADLMIPGVTSLSHHSSPQLPSLALDTLVAVTEYRKNVPMAIGRLGLTSDELKEIIITGKDVKGKAVLVLHSYKDALWETGSKSVPPEEMVVPKIANDNANEEDGPQEVESDPIGEATSAVDQLAIDDQSSLPSEAQNEAGPSNANPSPEPSSTTPSDMDALLRLSLLQAISTLVSSSAVFPIPSTQFLQSYLQSSRPYNAPPLDLKKSTYKNLTKFLKAVDKEGLIKVKEFKGDGGLSVLSVNKSHPDIVSFKKGFKTAGDVEEKGKRKEEKAKEEKGRVVLMVIKELWKPVNQSLAFFEEIGKRTTDLYTPQELRALVSSYISEHSLVHPTEPQYIILDDLLKNVFRKKNENVEFLKRDEVIARLFEQMQSWFSVQREGDQEAMVKKGTLKPIVITTKIRAGRKACTIVTGLEPYSISYEDMAEELKKVCAGATSFGAIPGSSTKGGKELMEVMVQGKHAAVVKEMLIGKGVPKKFVEEVDLTAVKKK